MRKITLCLLILLVSAGSGVAGQLKKSYFAATKVGTWAQYKQSSSNGSSMTTTDMRLADADGRIVIEHMIHVNEGPGKGTTSSTLSVLEPGFDLDSNLISSGTATQAMIAQVNEGEPSVTPEQVLKIIRKSSIDFSKGIVFQGSEKIGKYQCDYYTYEVTAGGAIPMTHIGKIWLNEEVPFGVVKQSAIIKDNSKKLSDFEMRLIEFGSDAKGTPALIAKIPKSQKTLEKKPSEKAEIRSYSLADAYAKEIVRLQVEAKEGSGGKRLFLVMKNQSKEAFFLTVARGPLAFEAAPPVNTLNLDIFDDNRIKLDPGQSTPPLEVGQTGKRGVVKGRFELVIYKGEPLITGSVTKDALK